MKKSAFSRSFQKKLLEDSHSAIYFADFSENLIENSDFFIGLFLQNSR